MFVDRRKELEFLERKWREKGPQLIVIYGRRRVGKTFLLKEFLKGKRGVYVLLTGDSIKENIKVMKEAFARLTGKSYFTRLEVGLEELFRLLKEEVRGEKVAVVLDEFQYLTQLDPGVLTILQRVWDEVLKDSEIFLVLCGSSIGMMEKLLEYKSPIYGRRTGQWKVEAFTIDGIVEMFPHKDFEEIVKIYAVFGGVPYYLSLIDRNVSVEENIKRKILTKGEVLYEEPEFLLREEFREPRVYKLILKYIALGYATLGELVSVTGFDRGNISRYLETLEAMGLLGYELPYGKRKRGRYYIRDMFFNFWFRYVYPNKGDLEVGMVEEVFRKILKTLNTYYGHAFERLVIDMLRQKLIDFGHTTVSRWWHKGEEVDAIAVGNKVAVAIEVKWKELTREEAERTLKELRRKTRRIGLNKEIKHYVIAKKVEGKEELNALDLEDLEKAVRNKSRNKSLVSRHVL